MRRIVAPLLAVAWIGFAILPWNAIGGGGFFAFNWLAQYPAAAAAAPALVQLVLLHRLWFLPLALLLLAPIALVIRPRKNFAAPRRVSAPLIAIGACIIAYLLAIALAIDIEGWTWSGFAAVFGPLLRRQPGLGYGALLVFAAALVLLCHGLALRGFVMGNTFVAATIGAAIAMVALFTLYPLARLFAHAFVDPSSGHWSLNALVVRATTSKIWGYDGVVWNTLQLGLMTATAATLLALCFVLIVTRGRAKGRRLLSILSVLPMITPPFVIGLALILLFGRSGAINAMLEWGFGWRPTRWIYGMPGVWLAQTLALTPVAYLVLVGVSEGVSAALEEAAQTLRASPLTTFAAIRCCLAGTSRYSRPRSISPSSACSRIRAAHRCSP